MHSLSRALEQVVAIGIAATIACSNSQSTTRPLTAGEFEERLRQLQEGARIPAISAGIAVEGQMRWARGFGLADVSAQTPATDSTVYHLASLTKPIAATVILQLVQEGRVSLDDPVSKYGVVLNERDTVRVRHLLSHTSHGTPGAAFQYDGDRFGQLESVISRADGRSFAEAAKARVIDPVGMRWTASMPTVTAFRVFGRDSAAYAANLAHGYTIVNRAPVATPYPTIVGAAAGLTSDVRDMLAFAIALEDGQLISTASRDLAFTPTISTAGQTLPYGLGWFATTYRGVRVVWHYGLWTAISSLIITVPDRRMTFVILANTDGLSAPYSLGAGNLSSSPWARAFLDTFVVGGASVP